MPEHFDDALVCQNGHVANDAVRGNPSRNGKHCMVCGAQLSSTCGECGASIRGRSTIADYSQASSISGEPRIVGRAMGQLPNFCYQCGKPHTWTSRHAEALDELLGELEGLEAEERERLRKSVPDILADTPKSNVAVTLFKKAISKVGQAGGKLLMDVLSKVATEAVKGNLGL